MLETLQIFSAKRFTKKDSHHLMMNLVKGEDVPAMWGHK